MLYIALLIIHAVPEAPSFIQIVPSYSNDDGALLRLNTSISKVG